MALGVRLRLSRRRACALWAERCVSACGGAEEEMQLQVSASAGEGLEASPISVPIRMRVRVQLALAAHRVESSRVAARRAQLAAGAAALRPRFAPAFFGDLAFLGDFFLGDLAFGAFAFPVDLRARFAPPFAPPVDLRFVGDLGAAGAGAAAASATTAAAASGSAFFAFAVPHFFGAICEKTV